MLLTANEKNVLRLLMCSFGTEHSINQIAKECGLAPNGALKILKKLENEGILGSEKIANIKSYRLDFTNDKTSNILELALMSEPGGRVKCRMDDLIVLKDITKCCILFGSYISSTKKPNDLDVLFVLENSNYKRFKERLNFAKQTIPIKIHDTVQTEKDLRKNIKNKDKVVLDALRRGVVLWGHKLLIKVLEDVYKR